MKYVSFEELNRAVSAEAELRDTVMYLAGHLKKFLKKNDRMLICFPDAGEGSIGSLMAQAIHVCGGKPIFWGPDRLWLTLLRQAFVTRATAIVAPPLVVLGLTKLAKKTGTPLYLRNVVTAGYPCLDWMIDGIRSGLDCKTWGCFGPGTDAVVGGFSCGVSRGVHIRQEAFEFEIVDGSDHSVPAGETGNVVMHPAGRPELRYRISESARLDLEPCGCGSGAPRLMDISSGVTVDRELAALGEELLKWTSILDCSLRHTEYGLEMELVVFPGEKLPKLPSCAKRVVRPWDRERDMPMMLEPGWVKSYFSGENH